MSEDTLELLRLSVYFIEVVFFVVITRKCFWEKYSFLKIVGAALLSPVTGILAANVLGITVLEDFSTYSSESIVEYAIMFSVIQTAMLLFFLAGYVWFVRAKNPSVALFVFLCYSLLVPNIFYVAVMDAPLLSHFLQVVLVVLFYVVLIRPLSKLTHERLVTNTKLFILLPTLTTIYNTISFALIMIINFRMALTQEDIKILTDTLKKVAEDDEETMSTIRAMLYEVFNVSMGNTGGIIYYSILFIALILIIAFAVIVKNMEYLNEVTKAKDELHELNREVMEALAHTIDAKDEYTRGHSTRVAKYARMIAERMGLGESQCENVYYMGLLHDIGKIAVPNEIINKPAKLTDEEYSVIKVHASKGFEILSEIKSRPNLAFGAESHHERVDGKGYPEQKKGDEIPIEARIIAVADSYDAMTSNRSYRTYMPQKKVRDELVRGIGTQFDAKPAECMIEILDEDTEYTLHE